MLMQYDAKQDYTHNAAVCNLRKLQLEMERIFVLNTAHTSEWSIWELWYWGSLLAYVPCVV